MKAPSLACLCAALAAAAHAAAPAVSLTGPEVRKLDWNTRMLQAADIDGDGLLDLIVANNDRGTVDLLLQVKAGRTRDPARTARANRWEPVVEDARFSLERVTTGVAMYDLVAADLDGDGRTDLAYTGDPQALTIQYRRPDGSWNEFRVQEAPAPAQGPVALRAADLDGDGRTDLVMLGVRELAIYRQTETGELAAPQRFPLADENCYGLDLLDLDGDGRPDIAYLATARRDALRVRLQNAQGLFGPEQAHAIKDASSTLQLLAAPDAKKKTPALLVYAQQRTGQLEFFNLEPVGGGKDRAAPALHPRVFTPRSSTRTPAAYALGDYNGDGYEDVAVADAEGAQVFVYFRQPDGGFSVAGRFPSFADVRSLAAIDEDGDGRHELVAVSSKEQVVGVSSLNALGGLDYPRPLPGGGRPLAVAAGSEGPKEPPLLVVLREEKGRRWFDVLRRENGALALEVSVPLNGLKSDPRAVRLVDANQDGRLDVAVFTPLDSLRVFLRQPDGAFADASQLAGFRKGLVDNLDAGAFSTGDVDGDGKPEMIVSTGGFARALRMTDAGELTVVDQFNARESSAEITATFVLPAAKGKRPEIVLYDRKGEQFQRMKANRQGVYEVASAEPAGRIDVVGGELRHRPGGFGVPDETELFLFGKDRLWWLPLGGRELKAKSLESYTTDLPDIHYADVVPGDLTGDGRPELVALDPSASLVEILARDEEEKAWTSRLHFKVFESDEHFQGRRGESYEPREAIIADVTGDGKNDLILLVHDRVLVYPQE